MKLGVFLDLGLEKHDAFFRVEADAEPVDGDLVGPARIALALAYSELRACQGTIA